MEKIALDEIPLNRKTSVFKLEFLKKAKIKRKAIRRECLLECWIISHR